MSEKDKFNQIICISPTNKMNNFYSDFINNKFIFEEFNNEYIQLLLKKLSRISNKLYGLSFCEFFPSFISDNFIK